MIRMTGMLGWLWVVRVIGLVWTRFLVVSPLAWVVFFSHISILLLATDRGPISCRTAVPVFSTN